MHDDEEGFKFAEKLPDCITAWHQGEQDGWLDQQAERDAIAAIIDWFQPRVTELDAELNVKAAKGKRKKKGKA